jgi:hypothetical protein
MKTFNAEKYIEALNSLLGADNAYYQGDKDRDAIVELVVIANELVEENEALRKQLETLEEKK